MEKLEVYPLPFLLGDSLIGSMYIRYPLVYVLQ